MPTISIAPGDLDALLGRALPESEWEARLAAAKGELKGRDETTGAWRVELNDTNRPDLWSAEGIARQVRSLLEGAAGKRQGYPVFAGRTSPRLEIRVDARLREVRPYIAAVRARGVAITEPMLLALIETQEKLAENYGRRRRFASVGLYAAGKLRWPLDYAAVSPDEARFVPLGFEQPLTLREILEKHPKGQAYRPILEGRPLVPIFRDSRGEILSFPPIINSRALGEVKPGDSDLLVEVTGTDLRGTVLLSNIFAANLADRGFRCERVRVTYPWETPWGREVATPRPVSEGVVVDLAEASRLLGEAAGAADLRARLVAYGCEVSGEGRGKLRVVPPPWRDDYMHPVDAIEDYAMARGYGSFAPEMPADFTVGAVHEVTSVADRVRDHLIGCGFEETIGNVLTDRATLRDRVRRGGVEPVTIANPTSELHGVLRDALLPGLLRLEGASPRATYPHRAFEVGEVQSPHADADVGSRTLVHAAALWASPDVSFSDLHALLEALGTYLDWEVSLAPQDHGTFIPGRAAKVQFRGAPRGWIGEVHPEVLDAFGIRTPAVGLEVVVAPVPETSP
ncbi:MAG: phenylalanine--tRNA ligase subunit beta [Planctomycetales bacterium]|nr:phenylalanine--tRNA ligase subunit beta [Planctomycetales bacterium]